VRPQPRPMRSRSVGIAMPWGADGALVVHGGCVFYVSGFELSNLVMVYLLGVTLAGLRLGRAPRL